MHGAFIQFSGWLEGADVIAEFGRLHSRLLDTQPFFAAVAWDHVITLAALRWRHGCCGEGWDMDLFEKSTAPDFASWGDRPNPLSSLLLMVARRHMLKGASQDIWHSTLVGILGYSMLSCARNTSYR